MEFCPITAVGIDVSKGKSTVAIRRPGGEIVMAPFQVHHTASDLGTLISTLRVHIPFASCHLHGKILPLCR